VTPAGWRCTKRVGFLFPHPCERPTPEGCPDCGNGSIRDPWTSRTDRRGYADDYYLYNVSSDEPGSVSEAPVFGGGDSGGGGASMDFSEADGAELTNSGEAFEDDLSAS
jgi:hypothetical protein